MGERVGVPIEGVWHVEHVGDTRVHAMFGTTVVPTVFTVDAMTGSELCGTLGLTDCFYTYAAWRADVERAGGRDAAMALSRPAPGAFWWAPTFGRPPAGDASGRWAPAPTVPGPDLAADPPGKGAGCEPDAGLER